MIVLLPGWAGFRSSLLPLEWRLQRTLGRPVVRARVGLGIGCIRRSAEAAAAQIEKLAADSGPIDLIGHSMGGLVASYILKRLDQGRHLRTVITLGTPHRGTPAVLLGRHTFGRLSASILQMAPRSEFLRDLAAAPVPPRSRLVSIASQLDSVVPTLYAQLPRRARQHNLQIESGSHYGLIFSQEVFETIAHELRRGERVTTLLRPVLAGACSTAA